MAPRYIIRTIDEDWIDLFDPPSRIDGKRPAWDEARRRVRVHPECKTDVIDRYTGAILWQSDPDIPPRYEVVAVDATVFHALETDLHFRSTSCPPTRRRTPPGPRSTRRSRNRPRTSSCCATPRQSKPSSRRPTTTSTTPMPHEGGRFRSPSQARSSQLHSKGRLGASLRDRATLSSPLRGLDPAGGYPSRLRSQARCALRLPRSQVRQWGNGYSSRRMPIVPHVLTAPTLPMAGSSTPLTLRSGRDSQGNGARGA